MQAMSHNTAPGSSLILTKNSNNNRIIFHRKLFSPPLQTRKDRRLGHDILFFFIMYTYIHKHIWTWFPCTQVKNSHKGFRENFDASLSVCYCVPRKPLQRQWPQMSHVTMERWFPIPFSDWGCQSKWARLEEAVKKQREYCFLVALWESFRPHYIQLLWKHLYYYTSRSGPKQTLCFTSKITY